MAKYSIGDNVFCTNEKWLHEKCSIMRVNKGSLLAKGVVYEVCSLATGDVMLVSEEGVTDSTELSIYQLRLSTGLLQSAFADRFFIPLEILQKWEEGVLSPSGYIRCVIQRILELEMELKHITMQ